MKNVMKKMMRMLSVLVCIIGVAAVHAAGVYADLYVTNNGEVKSIRVYDDAATDDAATGDFAPIKTQITSTALTDPHGIAIDAGYIYVADRASNSILVFNLADTEKVTPVKRIAGDTAKTGLNAPIGIAIYATKIYVANNGNNTVTAYDLSAINNVTTDISPTALPNISSSKLNGPSGIAVNATNIYVANLGDPNTVSVFDLEGVYQKQISSGLDSPIGVAVDESFIYVANYAAPDISVFDIGTLERKAIIPGPTTTGVNGTYGIAVDAKYIYLADSASNSIRVFNLGDTGDVKPQRVIGGLDNPAFIVKVLSPPAAPTGLTPTPAPASSTQINLSWTDTSNETGFKIFRNGVELLPSPKVGANVTTFSDNTGLTCNTSYIYKVKATNSAGDSAAAEITTTTSACIPPAAPTVLTATPAPASPTQINLSWTDTSNETGFKIFRNGVELLPSPKVGANVTTFTDNTGLTCNTPYTYTVKATNLDGDSADTTPATITTSACTAAYSSTPPAGAITAMNSTNPTTTLTVNETGTAAMNVTGITFGGTDPGKFSVTPNTFPVSIAASGTQPFTITCNASVAGTYSATMAVAHDAAGSPANYTLSCTVACTPATCILGDVNGDDFVDLNDAIHVLRILDEIPVDKINLNADVNGDHKIGLEELGYILQKVAGLRPSDA